MNEYDREQQEANERLLLLVSVGLAGVLLVTAARVHEEARQLATPAICTPTPVAPATPLQPSDWKLK